MSRSPLVVALALCSSLSLAAAPAACTSDATGPEGALERALAKTRPLAREGDDAARTKKERVTSRLTMTLGDGPARHTLAITRTLERDGARFRVTDQRRYEHPSAADPVVRVSDDDTVTWLFDGATLVWRHADGPWIERDALDGLAARTLARADDLAPLALAAWGDYVHTTSLPPRDGGASGTSGTSGLTREGLSLDPHVRPIALGESELAALRERDATVAAWLAATHRPTSIEGELARDAAGRLVSAAFTVRGSASGAAGAHPFEVVVAREPSELGAVDFTLPKARLPEARERRWRMIEDVLGDTLLPPYRAPTKPAASP